MVSEIDGDIIIGGILFIVSVIGIGYLTLCGNVNPRKPL